MGIIDDIVSAVTGFFSTSGKAQIREAQSRNFALTPEARGRVLTAEDPVTQINEELQAGNTQNPVDVANETISELFSDVFEVIEGEIIEEIENVGELTPDNVHTAVDDAEGQVLTEAAATLGTIIGLEAIPAFQMETHEEMVVQVFTLIVLEELLGREITALVEEGVDPALKQSVHRRARSKQADFKDWVEANRDVRWTEGDWPTRSGDIPDGVRTLFNDGDFDYLPDPDTYGTIPDQTDLFAFVGLESLEPEEIIEEAPQFGTIPNRAALEQILRVSGIPLDAQQVYLDLWENLPKSMDMVEQSIRLEEPIRVVDEAVFENRLTPENAVALIEADIREYVTVSTAQGTPSEKDWDEDIVHGMILEELRSRFEILASVPNSAPTRGQIERWFRNSVVTAEQFVALNDRFGILPAFFGQMVIDNAIRQGGEDIAEHFVLGRLSATEARFRLGLIGYSNDQAAEILAGTDPDDVIQDAFAATAEADQLPVGLAVEIGDARGAQLRAVGIDSLAALAGADVEDLTAVTGMSDAEATRAIQSAQRILQSGAQAS